MSRIFFHLLLLACLGAVGSYAKPAAAQGKYRGQVISLDLQDASIDSVFRIIAEVSGHNVVVHSNISGKVTLRLRKVPWDQVLDIVLRDHGLHQVTEGNVMLIVPIEKTADLYFRRTSQ